MPGLANLVLIFVISLITGTLFFFAQTGTWKSNPPKTTPSSVASAIPSPSPTPTPSPSPTATPTPTPKPTPSVASTPKTTSTSGGTTTSVGSATVLTYNLGSTTVVTDTGNDDDCSNNCNVKPLAQYISENGGRAGMNGTYFCPPDYSSCAGKVNSFDFPVWNNRKKKWINAYALFWGGRGMMVFRSGSAQFFPNSSAVGAPSDISGGIVNYPSLLSGSNILVGSDGAKGSRTGIGFGGGKLFLVYQRNANYWDLANTFKNLGASEALNLDGGGSVALYDGGYRAGPGRNIPNAVIIR